MADDLVSYFEGAYTFFCESTSFYCIFSILSLQLGILDYAIGWILWPPLLYGEAVAGFNNRFYPLDSSVSQTFWAATH